MKSLFVFFVLLMMSGNVSAQKSEIGNWFMYYGNQAFNKKWNLHSEVQLRNYNFIGDLQQILLRAGLGYNLGEDNNNVLVGYAYVGSKQYEDDGSKSSTSEHRVYQQFITRQQMKSLLIQHRYRVEERFIEDDFRLRLRYQLLFNIPLNSKTIIANTVYLALYDEVFINTTQSLFDRNRLYGALGYAPMKNIRIEVGFLLQTLEKSNRNQFQIALYNNLSLGKNK